MQAEPKSGNSRGARAGWFVLFLALGLLVFVVFSHIRPVLPDQIDPAARIVLLAGLLAAAWLARGSARFRRYWEVLLAFFIAALATSLDLYLPSREWLLKLWDIPTGTPAAIAVEKVDTWIIISASIILLTCLSGGNLASLYLKKGRLRQWLSFGSVAFVVTAAGAIPISGLFFGARQLTLEKVGAWAPWILLFILGNAFTEELLFRGLFLQKLDPVLGKLGANLVVAIPFTLHHTGVSYTPDNLMFLAILLPLALAWGYVMQKTDSLWGAFLFHAGMDIPVVLSLFSNL